MKNKWLSNFLIVFFVALTLLLMSAIFGHGATYTDEQAVHAIMGESAGECYQGKLLVACVIRNRHSLQGVYGANVSQAWLDKQPARVKQDAEKAWLESAKHDASNGCTMFGGKIDDHYFIDKLHKTPYISVGNQRFYK